MFDLKVINSVLHQLEEERGIPKEKIIEAIESALATAYKKENGKKDQIIKAVFDPNTGAVEFFQTKIVVEKKGVIMPEEEDLENKDEEDERVIFNNERHIFIEDARKIKKGVEVGEEINFNLESKTDFGRIAAQTAKQVIIQKIREAEKVSVMTEYGQKQEEIVSGTVQRFERGNLYIDMGRATGILPSEEQIPGERFRQGERVRAYLMKVEENTRNVYLRLSRSHPKFLEALFKQEAPEIGNGTVEVKAIAREPGSRSKIAVSSKDPNVDPVGSLVGQRGVRVSTVMSELGGEKIDIIEWSENPAQFVSEALSPAKVMEVEIHEDERRASVVVSEDQQSLAIGRGGQNVRLAAKLTGWKIDIKSYTGEELADSDNDNDNEEKPKKKKVAEKKEENEKANEETEIKEKTEDKKEEEETKE